jgi:hypothetical protein
MAGLSRTEWAALHKALGKLSDHTQSILGADGDSEPD